jgi:3'-phosphoadenosine 5'-phosphosulfate sulfotransferase (PAPS reductase)/FAD synthetase
MPKVIVNFSGGKDSTVAILETLKVYPKEDIMLCYQDTGADYIETKAHVELIAKTVDLPLITLKNNEDFWQLAKRRGYFPTPAQRQCTAYLKRDLFNKWVRHNRDKLGKEIIVVSGIRSEESQIRSKMAIYGEHPTRLKDGSFKANLWLPCFDMSEREVKDRVKAEGLPLHPCYDFSTRCSCWMCIFQPNSVVRTYAEAHPELYEHACLLEDEIKHKWKEHFAINDLMKQGRLL